MVTLLRLFGVSAKHLREDVSTTVSQKDTTGSATLTSTSAYSSRRSCGQHASTCLYHDAHTVYTMQSRALACSAYGSRSSCDQQAQAERAFRHRQMVTQCQATLEQEPELSALHKLVLLTDYFCHCARRLCGCTLRLWHSVTEKHALQLLFLTLCTCTWHMSLIGKLANP